MKDQDAALISRIRAAIGHREQSERVSVAVALLSAAADRLEKLAGNSALDPFRAAIDSRWSQAIDRLGQDDQAERTALKEEWAREVARLHRR
jgi:hypothetical protein